VGYLKGTEIKDSNKSRASGEAGVDGFELQSKYQFDYSKGLYYQIWNTNWTFEEYV
jgi:hypothetical protein